MYINEQACCKVVPLFQDDQEQFQILLSQTEQEGVHICQSKHHHGTADNKRHLLYYYFPYMVTYIQSFIQPLFIHDINSKLQACGVMCKNYK